MNRKYNPFVSLVALLLAAIILVLTCSGCTAAAEKTGKKPAPRFISERAGNGPKAGTLYIITDTQTGVQYLTWDSNGGCAMTVLQPGEG